MGILFGHPERRNMFPEPPIPPYLGADVFGHTSVKTNPDSALQVPAVWACVNLLANTVSTLPLELYRLTGNDDVPNKLPLPKLLTSPSPGVTQSEWIHQLMTSLALRGNAYGRVVARDQRYYPTQILMLNPDAVRVDVRDGVTRYFLGSNQTPVDPEDIFHVRGMTLPGSLVGLSPVAYAAAVIGLDLNSRRFAQDFFDGGGIPKAVLSGDQQLNQEQARTLKDRLMAAFKAREPIVLGAGVSYTPIQVKPEESQFLATQQADVSQIARYFNIPAEMVGGATSGSNVTYANLGERNLHFLQFTLSFWLKRIEDAFFPIFPQPQYVKFRVEELLRVDTHTRAQVDMFQIAAKVKTPTEVRESYGLPPMTEAQKVEANMVPLGIGPLGRPTALPGLNTPPGPPAAVPANDQQGAPDAATA
jgi:HK97 family phage portal protein